MADQPMPEEMTINREIGPDAAQMMMQKDDDVRVLLLSRLESMTSEELKALDKAIDGDY